MKQFFLCPDSLKCQWKYRIVCIFSNIGRPKQRQNCYLTLHLQLDPYKDGYAKLLRDPNVYHIDVMGVQNFLNVFKLFRQQKAQKLDVKCAALDTRFCYPQLQFIKIPILKPSLKKMSLNFITCLSAYTIQDFLINILIRWKNRQKLKNILTYFIK